MTVGVVSIRNVLWGVIGVMALVIFAVMGTAAIQAYQRKEAARRVATIALIDKNLFRAVQHFRFERGTMFLILGLRPEQNARDVGFALTHRHGVDAGLKEAIPGLLAITIPDLAAAVDTLKADYDTYQAVRAGVDRLAKLPIEVRDQAFRDGFMARTSRLQASIEGVASILESELRRLDPGTEKLIVTKTLAWAARSALGASILAVNDAVAGRRSLTTEELTTIRVSQGRIASAWTVVRQIAEGPGAPKELRTAFEEAQTAYFSGSFGELYKRLLDALSSGREPDITLGAWRELTPAPQLAVGRVSLVAMELIASRAEAVAAEARTEAIALIVALVITVALAAGGVVVVLARVSRPISSMTRAMLRLASGDLDVAIPCVGRRDEVGGMAAAVQVFKDNIIRLRETKAEVERANQQLDAAVSNIVQGLCLFGPDNTLQVVNRRFFDIIGAPPNALLPGATFRAVVDLAVTSGLVLRVPPEEHVRAILDRVAVQQTWDLELTFQDGHIVSVTHCRLPTGGWLATLDDITEQRQSEQKIIHLSRHDTLSGLPNRALFRDRVEHAIALLGRGQRFALHCLDLDHFKEVNDALGHAVGDGLLVAVAGRLRQCAREVDTVSRLGGDEFAVLQIDIGSPVDAEELANRLLAAVCEPYEIDGHGIVVGLSIGIALAPDDGSDVGSLLKYADMALYRAKAEGRGTFRFFEQMMDHRQQTRRGLEMDLRRALACDELELHYQPVLSTTQVAVTGFEAFLRWRHPDRGILQAAEFLPLATDTSLIIALGEWAVRQACQDATAWPQSVKVAVKVSPAQFHKGRLVNTVAAALADSGLTPERLELEITETALMSSDEKTLGVLYRLRGLGVGVVIDEFGTGYAPLSHLCEFRFDRIKIDRSLVGNLIRTKEAAAITRAIAGLGRELGIATSAEGIETGEQLAALRAEGCAEVQGDLFGPPRPNSSVPLVLQSFNGSGDGQLIDSPAPPLAAMQVRDRSMADLRSVSRLPAATH